MNHGPAIKWKEDQASPIKSKLGIWMFIVYTLVYAGFILINIINPKLMGTDIGSLNLAIVYGFGLIIFALILALLYNHVCTRTEEQFNKEEASEKEGEL